MGHLSFTEILDTSLKVSWSEPGEKNGVLTGTGPELPASSGASFSGQFVVCLFTSRQFAAQQMRQRRSSSSLSGK